MKVMKMKLGELCDDILDAGWTLIGVFFMLALTIPMAVLFVLVMIPTVIVGGMIIAAIPLICYVVQLVSNLTERVNNG